MKKLILWSPPVIETQFKKFLKKCKCNEETEKEAEDLHVLADTLSLNNDSDSNSDSE